MICILSRFFPICNIKLIQICCTWFPQMSIVNNNFSLSTLAVRNYFPLFVANHNMYWLLTRSSSCFDFIWYNSVSTLDCCLYSNVWYIWQRRCVETNRTMDTRIVKEIEEIFLLPMSLWIEPVFNKFVLTAWNAAPVKKIADSYCQTIFSLMHLIGDICLKWKETALMTCNFLTV